MGGAEGREIIKIKRLVLDISSLERKGEDAWACKCKEGENKVSAGIRERNTLRNEKFI
ncbi:MAG: hypothetical protein QXR84_00055 [Candidatus Bathyarchaeia archaeon]